MTKCENVYSGDNFQKNDSYKSDVSEILDLSL